MMKIIIIIIQKQNKWKIRNLAEFVQFHYLLIYEDKHWIVTNLL